MSKRNRCEVTHTHRAVAPNLPPACECVCVTGPSVEMPAPVKITARRNAAIRGP